MNEEKRPKPLPPSLRGRKRYIAYQVLSEDKFVFQDLINSIWHSLLNLLGELGTAETDLWIAKDTYDEKRQIGIIRCSHDKVEQVRAALALIERIGDVRVIVRVLGISGSIKATKMKFFSETKLTEFTKTL
ncbi:MAG: Rpp14/Pop5 family protein [Candidatus Aenigmatarchaeota archaeon]